jgi:stage II sporulation protein GA (sporulation sigma-E factor processing peptidase)
VVLLIVYADVLVFLNLIINYFLLLLTAKILNYSPKTLRIVLSALIGALSSLYIFLPASIFVVENLIKIAICSIMALVAFGFRGIKLFLKNALVLFLATAGFGGVMFAVWKIFTPNGMVINNSVVYFDISLVALVGFTVLGYLIFTLLFRLFSKGASSAERCNITVYVDNKSILLSSIVDTGNSIEDVFLMGDIIITDKKHIKALFGTDDIKNDNKFQKRYRLLPCTTVSGRDVLEGVRCDRAQIDFQKKRIVLKKPILAISKIPLNDGDDAIINPKILR